MTVDKEFKLTDLFNKGNAKLGKNVLTWSISAVHTCPGRSKLCEGLCYADKSFFKMASVRGKHHKNWQFSQRDDLTKLLKEVKHGTLLRIHVAGDIYDAAYAKKWLYILKHSPHIKAWLYSRSWRVPDILATLEDMANLPNVRVWYSIDKETGVPTKLHRNVRLAYLSTDTYDQPPLASDLVFRDYVQRKEKTVHMSGVLVCPVENGKGWHGTCEKCKLCFTDLSKKDTRAMKRESKNLLNKRTSLQLVE